MSEGSVFKRKDGKYCAKYKGADGSWKYIYRKTKTEAKQALREALKQRDEGNAPVDNKTVGALLDAWLQELEGTVSRRTWVNRECTMRVHLKPKLGNKKLSNLTPDDVSGLCRRKLAEGLAPSYVKRMHIILKSEDPEAHHAIYIFLFCFQRRAY